MICEKSIETYTLSYVKEGVSGSLVYDTGNSKPVLHDNLQGWGRQGRGGWVQEGGDTCMPMVNSCWCMAKNHHNTIKWLSSNQNKLIFKENICCASSVPWAKLMSSQLPLVSMLFLPGSQFHLEMLYLEPQTCLSSWGCEQAGEGWSGAAEFLICLNHIVGMFVL